MKRTSVVLLGSITVAAAIVSSQAHATIYHTDTLNVSLPTVFGTGSGSSFEIVQDDQTLSDFTMGSTLVTALGSDATVQFTRAFLNPPTDTFDYYAMTITAGAASFLAPGTYTLSYVINDQSADKGDWISAALSSYNATVVSPDLYKTFVNGSKTYTLNNTTGTSTSVSLLAGTEQLQVTDTITVYPGLNSDLSSFTDSYTHSQGIPEPGTWAVLTAALLGLGVVHTCHGTRKRTMTF